MKIPDRRRKGTPGAIDVDAGDFARIFRFMWTRLLRHQVSIIVPDDATRIGRQRVLLTFVSGMNRPVTIDLTNLTLPELRALSETVAIAVEVAEPEVMARDQEAREKQDAGDDSDDRCYRPLPYVVIRKGALRAYHEGLLLRRKNVLSGVDLNVMPGRRPAVAGGSVDEQQQEEAGAENLQAAPD